MGRDCHCVYLWHYMKLRGEELESGVRLYVVIVEVDNRGGYDVFGEDASPVESDGRGLGNGVVEENHLGSQHLEEDVVVSIVFRNEDVNPVGGGRWVSGRVDTIDVVVRDDSLRGPCGGQEEGAL